MHIQARSVTNAVRSTAVARSTLPTRGPEGSPDRVELGQAEPDICVYGAGSIGCYVGGRLQATGTSVQFVGRASVGKALGEKGLHLTDLKGADLTVPGKDIHFSEKAAAATDADVILVSVKSGGTAEAAAELAEVVKPGSVVISLQNGVSNVDVLRRQLPECTVLAGMVPFNVVQRGPGEFHQGTSGGLMVEENAALDQVSRAFQKAGIPIEARADMPGVQWSKLLMNLNNSINALAGLPLKSELSQRDYRRCLALAHKEGLRVLDKASIKPARLTPLPTTWIPPMLGLPNFIFSLVASKMLAIDPLARSSMQDDLDRGRKTEVEYINGAVVELGKKVGVATPVNDALIKLIHEAEQGGRRNWSGAELLARLREAARAR